MNSYQLHKNIEEIVISTKKTKKSWFEKSKTSKKLWFGRQIWDKLLKCIFKNFDIARVKREQFQIFQKSRGWFIPKIAWTKHVITRNHTKPTNEQNNLQDNTVNGAMSISVIRVVNALIHLFEFKEERLLEGWCTSVHPQSVSMKT